MKFWATEYMKTAGLMRSVGHGLLDSTLPLALRVGGGLGGAALGGVIVPEMLDLPGEHTEEVVGALGGGLIGGKAGATVGHNIVDNMRMERQGRATGEAIAAPVAPPPSQEQAMI